MLAGAFAGLVVTLIDYFTLLSGVAGTFGAGLVILSCLLIGLAAVLMFVSRNAMWLGILRSLSVLGCLLTALAGYFLHEWLLIGAMALALAGLIVDLAVAAGTNKEEVYA